MKKFPPFIIAAVGFCVGVTSVAIYGQSRHSFPKEFPASTCEVYNAHESNSAITVCRSAYAENRFFLRAEGFVSTPDGFEQNARRGIELLTILAGGADLTSADSQDPGRWAKAAEEYARSRYGSDDAITYFDEWPLHSSGSNPSFAFGVEPAGVLPPWGEWKFKGYREGSIWIDVLEE
jgi:hypothetical protein